MELFRVVHSCVMGTIISKTVRGSSPWTGVHRPGNDPLRFGTLDERAAYSFIHAAKESGMIELYSLLEFVWKQYNGVEQLRIVVRLGTHSFEFPVPSVASVQRDVASLLGVLDEEEKQPYTVFQVRLLFDEKSLASSKTLKEKEIIVPLAFGGVSTDDFASVREWCESFTSLVLKTAPLVPSLSSLDRTASISMSSDHLDTPVMGFDDIKRSNCDNDCDSNSDNNRAIHWPSRGSLVSQWSFTKPQGESPSSLRRHATAFVVDKVNDVSKTHSVRGARDSWRRDPSDEDDEDQEFEA